MIKMLLLAAFSATSTPNDLKASVYQWFAGFDHQVEDQFFLDRIDSEAPGFHLEYPGAAPITDAAGFRAWYQNVKDTVPYNSHDLVKLETRRTSPATWAVDLRVRWQAPGADLCIDQHWDVRETDGEPRFKTLGMVAAVVPGVDGPACATAP